MFTNPSGRHRRVPRKALANCGALALATALAFAGAAPAGAATQPHPVKPGLPSLARHLPSAKAAATQPAARTKAQWQTDIGHVKQPGTGCYRATYPALRWQATRCVAAPKIPLAPRPLPRPARHGGPDLIGNGKDYSAQVSGLISQATGTFADVSPGITEQGFVGGEGALTTNAFTLQLNSQFFSGSPACDGSSDPSGCFAWQQFVYNYEGCSVSCIFMQYWLIKYDATCPSGWYTYSVGDSIYCFTNSEAVEVNGLTASELASAELSASAKSGGDDGVSLSVGSGTATSVTNGDSKIDLAAHWNTTEWGVYGDGGGSEAYFGSGTTLQAQTAVTSTGFAAPSCIAEGFTGETSNLTLTSTPALGSEPSPTMASRQTNGTTGTASCSAAPGAAPTQLAFAQGPGSSLSGAWYSGGSWKAVTIPGTTGQVTSAPSAFQNAQGDLYVFAQGPGSALSEAWYADGSWKVATVPGTAGQFTSAPSAFQDAQGDQYVFAQGPGSALSEASYSGGSWKVATIPGTAGEFTSAPSAFQNAQGDQFVFAQGPGSALSEAWLVGPSWKSAAIPPAAGQVTSAPSAFQDAQGDQFVFAQGPGSALSEAWLVGPSWKSATVSGTSGQVTSAPSAFQDAQGDQFVFAQGPGSALSEAWHISGSWKAATVPGTAGQVTSAPSALQ
jgi:hypothetical protein